MASSVRIQALSDLTLLDIFNRLPMSDLFVAGRVCSRFMQFRRMSAKSRPDLTLSVCPFLVRSFIRPFEHDVGIANLELFLHDDGSRIFADKKSQRKLLKVHGKLSMECSKFITELLPAISDLDITVEAKSTKNLDGLIRMLELLTKVTRLRIILKYDNKLDYNLVTNILPHVRLLYAINSMTVLKRLEFHYSGTLIKNRYARINLPVLAQLEEFVMTGCDDFEEMSDSITRFAVPNLNLTKIALNSVMLDPYILTQFIKDKPEFAARFTNICLFISRSDDYLLEPLFDQLLNLTAITILFNSPLINLYELYRSLSPLHQLVHIKFVVSGSDLNELASHKPTNIENVFPRLTSVKMIYFQIANPASIKSHSLFAYLRLGYFFPQVQVVQLLRERKLCQECTKAKVDPLNFYFSCFGHVSRTLQMNFPLLKKVLLCDFVVSLTKVDYVIDDGQGFA